MSTSVSLSNCSHVAPVLPTMSRWTIPHCTCPSWWHYLLCAKPQRWHLNMRTHSRSPWITPFPTWHDFLRHIHWHLQAYTENQGCRSPSRGGRETGKAGVIQPARKCNVICTRTHRNWIFCLHKEFDVPSASTERAFSLTETAEKDRQRCLFSLNHNNSERVDVKSLKYSFNLHKSLFMQTQTPCLTALALIYVQSLHIFKCIMITHYCTDYFSTLKKYFDILWKTMKSMIRSGPLSHMKASSWFPDIYTLYTTCYFDTF